MLKLPDCLNQQITKLCGAQDNTLSNTLYIHTRQLLDIIFKCIQIASRLVSKIVLLCRHWAILFTVASYPDLSVIENSIAKKLGITLCVVDFAGVWSKSTANW